MSDHLPECPDQHSSHDGTCICPQLRACEQRVRARYSAYLNADNEGSYAAGFRDAMHAAREAVAVVGVRKDTSYDMRVQALAAIDTLINPPSLPPTTGRAHKY